MPRQRRLYRAEIYRQLERLKRKWRKLDFCDFVLRAEHELNPELSNEPDDNFGLMEAIRGYIVPIPLRYRQDDIRQYIDNLGRPDLYAKNYFNRQILRWNGLRPGNRRDGWKGCMGRSFRTLGWVVKFLIVVRAGRCVTLIEP